jgi:serine/threonine-protein kinase
VLDWRVPGYRPLRELRPGTVLAHHEASGHPVLLRYHPPGPEPALAARRADARALAGLASPHIASLYEHIEVVLPGQPADAVGAVTVREYVDGASVRSLLARSPLPPESALSLLRAGLLALQRAHEAGVTHRGYKPENLLVDAQGSARLADFAVTPAAEPSGEKTESEPTNPVMDDIRAAFAVFLACLGARDRKLPRRLRGLAQVGAEGDGPALLEAVEQAGRAGWGPQWCSRGEQELARRVARARRRAGAVV